MDQRNSHRNDHIPGPIALTDGLFGVALVATYFGFAGALRFVARRLLPVSFHEGFATTLVVVTSLLIFKVQAKLKQVDRTFVMKKGCRGIPETANGSEW